MLRQLNYNLKLRSKDRYSFRVELSRAWVEMILSMCDRICPNNFVHHEGKSGAAVRICIVQFWLIITVLERSTPMHFATVLLSSTLHLLPSAKDGASNCKGSQDSWISSYGT